MPSSNTTMKPEFYRMAPQGVSIHSARMRLTEFTHDALMKIMGDVQREAELLSSAHVDVIVYGCSTCSLVGGVDWEQIITDQIHFNTGAKVITVNQAVVEAIRSLDHGVVGVVTPHSNALKRLEKRYLEAHGLKVSSINGLGLYDAYKITNAKDETILELGEQAARDATGATIARVLEAAIREYGPPEELLSDNGAQFRGRKGGMTLEVGELCRRYGIRQVYTSPNHPQTIGKAEHAHKDDKMEFFDGVKFETVGEGQWKLGVFDVWQNGCPNRGLEDRPPAMVYGMPISHRECAEAFYLLYLGEPPPQSLFA